MLSLAVIVRNLTAVAVARDEVRVLVALAKGNVPAEEDLEARKRAVVKCVGAHEIRAWVNVRFR